MIGPLEIRTLGGFPVRRPGAANVGFESDLVRALLAFPTLKADQPHRRAALAALLWPDQAPSEEFFPAQCQTWVKAYA